MFIDTHAHLNFKAFNDDYQDAIERASDANVRKIINVGSNLETSEKAIAISSQLSAFSLYASVGLHPIHVADEKFDYDTYLNLAKEEKVVAIGETGIDLFHDKNTYEIQKEIFSQFLLIAKEVNKPVIIHCREANNQLLEILKSQKALPKGVIHCFCGDWKFAKELLDLGFLISFTGIITFTKDPSRVREPRRGSDLLEAVEKVPLDKIMIETDCPYLAPQNYRGKRNEPAYVTEVAKKIAEIKNLSLTEVEKTTTINAIKLFNLN